MTPAPASAAPPFAVDTLTASVRAYYDEDAQAPDPLSDRYLHRYLRRVLAARVAPGQRVLEIGCGAGRLLAALRPSRGVGVDLSARAVEAARTLHGQDRALEFVQGDGTDPTRLAALGGPFDVIVLVNVIPELHDVQAAFEALHAVAHGRTRILVYSYSRLWQPVLRAAEALRLKHRQPPHAWLPPEEVRHMLHLADHEVVRRDFQVLLPAGIPLLATLANRYLAHLPFLEWLSLMYGLVVRPAPARHPRPAAERTSVSVVIPCRNEAGHVPELLRRLPRLGPGSEFLLVEGNSSDDTEAVLRRAVAEHPALALRFLKQPGRGKGDAVRAGFLAARGEVLVILDADMGVAPEDVPRFVEALARGKGELINGSRMVYPMEGRAMRFLNLVANKAFAVLFTWLLGQQVRDTLCGTKALYRDDYAVLAANRGFFGDFDPFGDFDLLFGASRLDLRIVDVAIRYHERTYGTTNISRFRHGWLLLRMSVFAARKLRFA